MADQVTEEAPALTSTATTRQTEPAVIAGISSGEGEMVWSFEIVPVGGHQRLAAGNFNAPDIEAAQQPAQTVNETRTPGFSTYKGRVSARDGLAAGGKRIRTLGPRYVDDAFETILVAWLAFAFSP